MKLAFGARTDVGRIRDGNEDSYLADSPLFVVADGMGGHLAGDVASDIAVRIISDRYNQETQPRPHSIAAMLEAANSEIWSKAQQDASLRGMGTTCTLLYVQDHEAIIAHVGDSRAYRLRDGALEQLTEDHTLVGRMVKEGRLRPEDAEHHPQRSIITRALGVENNVTVDAFTIDVRESDRLLLCSDGLSGMVDADAIRNALATNEDPQAAAAELVDLANAAGGEDNITVVVVDVLGDGSAQGAPAEAVNWQTSPRAPAVAQGPPAQAAPRQNTPPDAGLSPPGAPSRGRRRWPLWILATLLVVAGAFFVARYALSNSWFVGADATGRITIFRGIPEDIAGLTFRDAHEPSDIFLDDLPEFLRGNFQDGRKVDSLQEARAIVAGLEDRVQEFRQRQTETPRERARRP